MPLRGMQPVIKKNIGRKHTKSNMDLAGQKHGDNIWVYEPTFAPAGSLILLMGMGGDLSWTMTQWWYLHPEWRPEDQEWCSTPGPTACAFGAQDKLAVQHLRDNWRIVDAVGTIVSGTGFKWYDYENWEAWPDSPPNANELDMAVANVFHLIEHEYKVIGDYKRIVIAGMSQGADLALEVGIRYPNQLGMVISQRGVLQKKHAERNGTQSLAAGPGTPFVLTAGDADELSPLATYKGSCASLQLMQTPVYFKSYPGVDHGGFCKPEWSLLIQIWSLMLASAPTPDKMTYLTTWDSCVA